MSAIARKTNFVLRILLAAFFLIIFRIWHLSVVQREDKVMRAMRAQRKTHLVRADRGAIYDRFQVPLACNRICYNAAIYYNQIAEIAASKWRVEEGEKRRVFPRREYIQALAKMLAEELGLEAGRVEDEISAKAALFPHAPYVVKANLTEREHARLSQLERQWPGLHAEIASERFYPLGKVAADVIGTMGNISSKEYQAIASEMSALQEAVRRFEEGVWEDLPQGYARIEDVYRRLYELKEKAYTVNDRVGKTGIEAQFERELRGYFGKESFEIDHKGRPLRHLPSSYPAIAGQQIVLSLSAELQQFAEELLIQHEKIREGRSLGFDKQSGQKKPLRQPWIKGGAIVAMDPHTGEILALASHPRFDPNDFILSGAEKKERARRVERWLELDSWIADLWDGKQPFLRERFDRSVREESLWLTWESYLQEIVPPDSPLTDFFRRFDTVKAAVELQEDFELALYHLGEQAPEKVFDQLAEIQAKTKDSRAHVRLKRLEAAMRTIPSAEDKLFAIDLMRLAVYSAAFSDELIREVGSMKLSAYFAFGGELQRCEEAACLAAKKEFHKGAFREWREANQKSFLAKKREKERKEKTYARPYLDYLDQKEAKLFKAYWREHRLDVLADLLKESLSSLPEALRKEWLHTFRSYRELDRPLIGRYKRLRKGGLEKHLAAAFYPIGGFGFSRSASFQAAAPPGSIFKLVSAYTALSQNISSFSMVDEQKFDAKKREIVGYALDKTPYPRHYKGGRLPKSHTPHIGKVDLVGALEQSSNPYFAILAGDFFGDPEDLCQSAKLFGFGEKTGIDLPYEAKGNLPNDLKTNRTGLYSFAIGQHTALATPLQAASMLSALANGGRLIHPKLAKTFIGPAPDRSALTAFNRNDYFAKEELHALGIPFSLFTTAAARLEEYLTAASPTKCKRQIPLSPSILEPLFEGMDRGVWGAKGSARANAIRSLFANPRWMHNYLSLQHQMIGKTGTAEIAINPYAAPSSPSSIYKHIWFGSIALSNDKQKKPELVVLVFLRYADGGKEAAPLAAEIIHKYREIKNKNLAGQRTH